MDELDERSFRILQLIREHVGPVGSGGLAMALQREGVSVSEATVGRLLRELEDRRLLSKDSRRGRILTPMGEEVYQQQALRSAARNHGRALQDLLQSADRDLIMQVLAVRRAVEGEAAALAAKNATAADVARIEETVAASQLHVEEGTYSATDDDAFHNAIAAASHNRVLQTVVRLIRESEGVSQILMEIRHRVGRRSLADHEAILLGIRSRDPEMARAAMLFHVERVRLDAIKVWQELDEEGRGRRPPDG